MAENGTVQIVNESSLKEGPTEFLLTMHSDKTVSFWGVKEKRYLEMCNGSKFTILSSRQDGTEYDFRFQLMLSCDYKLASQAFLLVDLPIFRYFVALKLKGELYFLVRDQTIGESKSVQLKKMRFVGETQENGAGIAALLEFRLQQANEGMHRLRLIGSSYQFSVVAKESNSPEFLLVKDLFDSTTELSSTTGFVSLLNLMPTLFNTRNLGEHLQLSDQHVLPFTRTDLLPTVGISFRYAQQPESDGAEIVLIMSPEQIGHL